MSGNQARANPGTARVAQKTARVAQVLKKINIFIGILLILHIAYNFILVYRITDIFIDHSAAGRGVHIYLKFND